MMRSVLRRSANCRPATASPPTVLILPAALLLLGTPWPGVVASASAAAVAPGSATAVAPDWVRSVAPGWARPGFLQAPGQDQASAQDQPPRLRTEVDTTVVTVGDPITMQVSVDHSPGARVAWPDSLDLAPFEVLGARAAGPDSRDGVARSTLTLALAAYELGELEIPGFQVPVVGAQGDTTLLDTNPFGIRVESVGLDEGGDIRALKGPVGLPMSPARLALWALALTLLGVLAFAAYRRLRRRGGAPGGAAVPAVPPRPPHEVALEALERLEASPLLERGEVKDYHIRLSDILRTYVEGRFRVPALEMTTRDIMAGLEGVGAEPSVRPEFRAFLDRCDMVKFAKNRPDTETSRDTLALGRTLVEKTVPEPESDPEDAP